MTPEPGETHESAHEQIHHMIARLIGSMGVETHISIDDIMWGMTKGYADVMAQCSLMMHFQSGHTTNDDLAYSHIGRAGMLFERYKQEQLDLMSEPDGEPGAEERDVRKDTL